ncbi:MAG: amidohydrolase family protein [Anaerolineaceae bacterium]|nr:amidohydrolase family protein [Anaerolineaceae bacterium]
MKNTTTVFTNAIIITMDESFHQFEPGALVVIGDTITAVGPQAEIESQFSTADQVIDCGGKILMPGLVNVHTHVPMTLLRGLADDLRLDVWLMGYMMPVEREFVSPEFVRLGTKLACAEMIRGGTTSFADMYYFEDDIADETAKAGMRAVCGESVLKFPSPDASAFEDSMAYAETFIQKWQGHELIVPTIAPHAPYTCTDEILEKSAQLAKKYNVPLHTHLSETSQEVENMRHENGMPVIPYVKKQGLFEAKVIAAHCVHLDDGEIHTLLHHGAGVAHNPSSNVKLASGIAPIKQMLDHGLKVGIGTDGPGSNNDLDMFEEIRLASFLSKVSTGDPTALPAKTAMLMGTRMGASVLGLDHITGSLEAGKRADLILVDISDMHNMPRFSHNTDNIYAQLVYAAKSSDVSDVMINGNFVLREKQLLTIDLEEVLRESQKVAEEIDAFLKTREDSVLSKLIAVGGAMEEESFEIQYKVPVDEIDSIVKAIKQSDIEILRTRHYHEYDTYFEFDDPAQGFLRYREDHIIEDGVISNVRSRLTLIGQAEEEPIMENVILSRSRFLAPATQSFRFYREYFKPAKEREIEKDRLRFHIQFQGTEFYINLDNLLVPDLGYFFEIKSRTWSKRDAKRKAKLITDLIKAVGLGEDQTAQGDYIRMLKD